MNRDELLKDMYTTVSIAKEMEETSDYYGYYVFLQNGAYTASLEYNITCKDEALRIAQKYSKKFKRPIYSHTKDIVLKGMQVIQMN